MVIPFRVRGQRAPATAAGNSRVSSRAFERSRPPHEELTQSVPPSRGEADFHGREINQSFRVSHPGFLEDLLLRTARRLIIFSARSGQGGLVSTSSVILNTPMDDGPFSRVFKAFAMPRPAAPLSRPRF